MLKDFNNMMKSQDRIGGRMVIEADYIDLQKMMHQAGLSEMDNIRENYTWFNKHTIDPIYFRIDRVLANTDWFLAHMDTTLQILPPNISDHAMLYLFGKDNKRKGMKQFKI